MTKAELRQKYKQLRAQLSDEEIQQKSLSIANHLMRMPIWEQDYFHVFLPIERQKEINTEMLLPLLWARDKQLIVSKSDMQDGSMRHFLLEENTRLQTNAYGIPEPVDAVEVSPTLAQVILVPLLAYDTNGQRVGYGKGFYDRFLAQSHSQSLHIGLSFFEPEAEPIPAEATDRPLHGVVHPGGVLWFRNM